MVKNVSPVFKKLFQNVDDPVLVLNTSCQIVLINDFAADMLKIDSRQKEQVLPMDEHSKASWSSFIDKIKVQKSSICTLNIQLCEDQYKEIKIVGYYHEEKGLIFSRIIPLNRKEYYEVKSNSSSVYSLFNDISHGVILTNTNGEIVDINDHALQYFQCEKSQLINKQHETIFNYIIDYEYSKLQYFSNFLNIGRASINVSSSNERGDDIYLKLDSKFNCKMGLVVTTITDETEIILLKRKVEQQNMLKDMGQMAASIAHEIRNPMTSLKGFVELLKLNTEENCEKYLEIMDSELHRMESILTELLYLSKPKARQFEEVSMKSIVDEVVELMLPHARLHNVILDINSDSYVEQKIKGNDNRLKQMLINLVKNAIEVMQNGGIISISLKNTAYGMTLSITDEGPGLSGMELNNLFVPFFTTKESGTGLGLILVKKVVEEHHGTINVESVVGIGTTFEISLPVYEAQMEDDDQMMTMWYKRQAVTSIPVV